MKIEKANWTSEGDNIRITMPLQKVDKERRIVSGFATLDSEDLHGDIVTKEASKKAFENFRGNIRLMHQPIPAGKLVNAREEEFFDKRTNKVYNGIYVDAYISKGAEHIWEMVNDGTLTGFSIGGNVKDAESKFNKDAGKTIRYIKDYEMIELSLVDNPANQLSNILSIQKSADGSTEVDGMLAKVQVENVFYCKKGDEPVAIVASDETKDCIDCGAPMQNIGWFESDGGDKAEKVNSIIEKFESTEGGENMADKEENVETPEDVVENTDTQVESAEEVSPKGDDETVAPGGEEAETATEVKDENVSVTGTGAEKVEEAEVLNEDAPKDGDVEENPLTKMFDDLRKSIQDTLDEHGTKHSEALAEAADKFQKGLEDLRAKHDELSSRFGTLTEKVNGVQEKLGAVEKSGAVRKSAELGGSEEESSLKKSNGMWGGAIFSMDSIR